MSKGATFTQRDLDRDPALKALVEAALERDRATIKESGGQPSLGRCQESQNGLVNIAGKVTVHITRVYSGRGRPYDDDNLSGGCKQLRDAISAILGLQGDSKEDGIAFAYHQKKGKETQTLIEIYRTED